MHQFCPIQALLALVLLEQKMVAAVTVEDQLPASGFTDAFLRAAVGLQFRHTDEGL